MEVLQKRIELGMVGFYLEERLGFVDHVSGERCGGSVEDLDVG